MQNSEGANVAVVSPPQGCTNAAIEVTEIEVDYSMDEDDDDSGQTGGLPLTPLDAIQGYTNVTFDSGQPLPPPSCEDIPDNAAPSDRPQVNTVAMITEQAAREAMLKRCSKICCYGDRAAKEMSVTNMASTLAYHYILESFGEARSTAWKSSIYTGGPVDGPINGPAPEPWNVAVNANTNFQNETRQLPVPHTASVKPCKKCKGRGSRQCMSCYGSGRISHTEIRPEYRRSAYEEYYRGKLEPSASNTRVRYTKCYECGGAGYKRCKVCEGHGEIKWFIQLTVVWTNHVDDFILNASGMPDKKIRKGAGMMAFEEERPRVFPVNHCPEPSVNEASTALVNKHQTHYKKEKILLQRHRVRIVPVTEVGALWKEKAFQFCVYGLEHRVYTKDYPQKCCSCSCSLL